MTDVPPPDLPAAAPPGGGFAHRPVMVDEVVALFAPVPAGTVVDATVGGAGHARALLTAHDHLAVLGLDRDPFAVEAARSVLAPFGDRARVRHARFDRLADVVGEEGVEVVSGVLFDLGVSSPQLDRAERGFSHRRDGPLDMRMDPGTGRTAADVVNHLPETELAAVLRTYGDERYARRIARAVVASRPLRTTAELAEIVRDAIPAPARRRGGHPARRTFQAVRIEVNGELAVLPGALDAAVEVLAPAGRVVALAYHSGEDRIVKERLQFAETGGCTCPPGLPCACGATPSVRLVGRRKSLRPSEAEMLENRRSQSARLRAAEKLPVLSGAA